MDIIGNSSAVHTSLASHVSVVASESFGRCNMDAQRELAGQFHGEVPITASFAVIDEIF
jgi:hypothetical protein